MTAAWILTAIIVVYFFFAAYRIVLPLVRLKQASGRITELPGTVIGYKGEEEKAYKGEKIVTAYPVYSLQICGEEKEVTAYTRMLVTERKENQKVTMLYDEKTGGVWCKDDLKIMRATVKKQLILIALLLIAVVGAGQLP